jgi:signal transduction histidine kinase
MCPSLEAARTEVALSASPRLSRPPANLVREEEAARGGWFYRLCVRRLRLPPYVADSLLALVLGVPTVVGLVADEQLEASPWLIGPLAALTALPLGARRYRPLAVFVVTVAAWLAILLAGVDTFAPGVLVATYTLAAHCERQVALRAGVAAVLLLAPAHAQSSGRLKAEDAILTVVALVAAWILGDNMRTRRAYYRELEEKAERLEREREESERRAAAEEQARIARELHDVIAHNVSVMVLQAAGGREVIDTDPRRAGEALAAIEATGRDALAELRRLLGVVGDGGAAIAPQPGLSHIDALVDQVRAAGLEAELVLEGDTREVPAGVELSAYRVVQESLTNTLRHAFARHVWVFVRRREHDLEVEVVDDGAGPPATATASGRGLVGMRERVALFGGEFEAGPRSDGGFRVRARFPT